MQKVFVTVAVGLVLNLPSTTLGQTEPPADSANLIELRIGGAVRNGGLYNVDRTLTTISDVLTMAGRAAPQGNGDKVWVFRDGEVVTTILGGTTRIADSPIRSGDQLFVAWQSAVPQRSWISQNAGLVGAFLAVTFATIGIIVAN